MTFLLAKVWYALSEFSYSLLISLLLLLLSYSLFVIATIFTLVFLQKNQKQHIHTHIVDRVLTRALFIPTQLFSLSTFFSNIYLLFQ